MNLALLCLTLLGQTYDDVLLERSLSPVRAQRPLTIGGELGWNGLAGFGVQLSYDLHPHFSLDSGLGLSATGIKVGLRGRYNLLTNNFTPFVGAGVLLGSGLMGQVARIETQNARFDMRLAPSPFAQGVVGLSYVAEGGFAVQASVGWAQLLRDGNYRITERSGHVDRKGLNTAYGSGLVSSLMLGYAI
jgi:hypothetical protein